MDKRVGYWLQRAARAHRALVAEALQDLGLFPGQEQTLLVLASRAPLTIGDLANALEVRPPTVSKAIQRLAAQGLISRSGDKGDARRSTVALTEEGARRAKLLETRLSAAEESLLSELDGKSERRLRKLLRKISRSLHAEGDGAGDDAADED